MADDSTASIIQFQQPKKAPMSGAERARLYRQRKAQRKAGSTVGDPLPADNHAGQEHVEPSAAAGASEVLSLKPARPGFKVDVPAIRASVAPEGGDLVVGQFTHPVTIAPVTEPVTVPAVTPSRVTPSRPSRSPASIILMGTSFALAGVGITMNGWFARSLGSSDIAGWLFLAIGVAADSAALALPSCAATAWQARQRGAALAGWLVWTMTFAFAVTAGIGFASVNIADVTTARASRVTPAVTAAQTALSDAMASRDRECAGGVGKFCRQREDAVTARRADLDAAMHAVETKADPQTEAAIKIVAWLSAGTVRPTGDDFAMVRLILLALLPQIGGVLLMLARAGR